MFFIFIILSILVLVIHFNENRSLSKSTPMVAVVGLSVVGIICYNFINSIIDTFIIFEIISLLMYAIASKKFDRSISYKFISYLPLVFVSFFSENYSDCFYLMFCIINVLNIAGTSVVYSEKIKIPMISFNIYSLLTISNIVSFEIEIYWIIVLFVLLIGNILLNKLSYSRTSYNMIYVLLTVSLLTLNHIIFFKYAIVLLFLIFLILSFFRNQVSVTTYNNLLFLVVCLSMIPTLKQYMFFVIFGLIVITARNYRSYRFAEVSNV